MRCWVKSRNERNPHQEPRGYRDCQIPNPGSEMEEGGDDVKSSCSLCPGLHTCYNGRVNGWQAKNHLCLSARGGLPKPGPTSDRGLQLAHVKPESLVIAGQQYGGEYVPEPCTHRPSRHGSRPFLKLSLVRIGKGW